MSAKAVLHHAISELDVGRNVALCVIVATRGSTPQPAGVMVCVDEAAQLTGTLGGGCVEADVRRQAHALLAKASESRNATVRPSTGNMITFQLDHDFGYDDGMICGGQMDVAVAIMTPSSDTQCVRSARDQLRAGEGGVLPIRLDTGTGPVEYRVKLEAEPKLVIAGAGHISRVLAAAAAPLGFSIDVIDDRSDYANKQRFPPPVRTTVAPIDQTLQSWPIDANTYIVIVTRGHQHDEQALRAVLDSPAKYIGMIGSRRKIKVIFDDLRHTGASEDALQRVHAPIGLDIGAVTTHEIAVSIAAQLVSIRRRERRKAVEGPLSFSDKQS